MTDLQKVEFELFLCFNEVCKRLNINYFLLSGSALGAVRHGGFIPWDDDLDVGMYRDDYNKFMVNSDVILAGHNLGGEIRLPFTNGLLGDNQYNDNYYVVTLYLMFIMPAGAILGLLLGVTYSWSHNELLIGILLALYLISIIPVLFLDKVNGHTKHDIRVPGSWFLFYSVGVPLIPIVLWYMLLFLGFVHP
jgi:hypothetical protein